MSKAQEYKHFRFFFVINKCDLKSRTSSRVGRISCLWEDNFFFICICITMQLMKVNIYPRLQIWQSSRNQQLICHGSSICKSLHLRGANSRLRATK
jgi:hypothetical protein